MAMTRFAAFALAAVLCLPGLAAAQSVNVAVEVQGLAPQLVPFAGSQANFQNLVNGLAQGTPISLVGTTAEGLRQPATFPPSSTLSALQIAQALEQARQALISRGVATPTPEQIGVALVGGALPTPAGSVSIAGILIAAPSASAGASTATATTPALTVTTRPLVPAAALPGTTLGTAPLPGATSANAPIRNTSDSPFVRNTSDSPFTRNTSDTPAPSTIPGAIGNPSPALQMQQRR